MKYFFLIFVLYTPISFATEMGRNVTIEGLIKWQDKSPTMIRLSNGKLCHVPNDDPGLLSVVLTAYVSKKHIVIHCNDNAQGVFHASGYESYAIHMIYTID